MNIRVDHRLYALIPVAVILLTVLEIVSINRYAGSGKIVRSIDIQIDGIRQENEFLRQRIASHSSLIAISEKSKNMGFVTPQKSQYVTILTDQLPVALNTTQ